MNGDPLQHPDKKSKNELKNALRKYAIPCILLAILIIIASFITYFRIKIQISTGPTWDTYDFLANALEFSGIGTGYSDLTRPPFLSFLTSISFRLGYVSEATIYAVTGALYILGVVGLYFLLKLRFNRVESFLGSLLFATYPLTLSLVADGLSDIPSISFSIWALFFTVLAVKKNSKFFYLSFLFLMLAFLTRYTAALIIFPMIFYILISREHLKNFKDILIGILISVIPAIPVLLFFYEKFGNPLFSFAFFFNTAEGNVSVEHFAYNSYLLYYLTNLPSYIGAEAIATILIIIVGFLLYWIIKVKKRNFLVKKSLRDNLRAKNTRAKIKLILFVILTLIFVGTFGKIAYMGSEVIFFALCYLIYELSKNLEIKNMDINLLFLSWFMAYFVFHSVFVIKTNRYFVTMTPALSYFIVLGLSLISDRLGVRFKNINLTSYILPITLVFMIILSTNSYLQDMPRINHDSENIILASNWLENHDPAYKTKVIYADAVWPYFSWYLKTNVKAMPIFKDNKTYLYELKGYKISPNDNIAFNNELEKNNVDYYFCVRNGLNLTSYKPIQHFEFITLYEKSR